ncbi:hypothetical protein [Streptosporangium roseum]|uniref:zinc finger domain-containing protein n=1 Tax=Streptosporangium roseum TaxID=2001 RepID=UPI0009DF7EE1
MADIPAFAESTASRDTDRDADAVERHACPRCGVEAGSPCRSRGGAVAGTYQGVEEPRNSGWR